MDIENGYFLAKFQISEDYEKVLSQGPWIIFGQYLMVQPWTIDFNSMNLYPSNVLAWIRLPGLPSYLYKKEVLWEIEGMVGMVTKFDFSIDSQTRGQYARMTVYINLEKPLIPSHQWKPSRNRVRKLTGFLLLVLTVWSLQGCCPHIQATGHNLGGNAPAIGTSRIVVDSVVGSDEYGPWMLVERRSKRNSREQNIHGKDWKQGGFFGIEISCIISQFR